MTEDHIEKFDAESGAFNAGGTVKGGDEAENGRHRRRAWILAGIVAGLVLLALVAPSDAWAMLFDRSMWRGPEGVALFVAVYALWNFALPPAPLQALAGAYYGLGGGLGVIVVATIVANATSHGIGRYLGRKYIAAKTENSRRIAALDRTVRRLGWKAVALLRLSNLIPSNILNLLLGCTPLKLPTILWASALGSIPGWILMLTLGRGGLALLNGPGLTTVEAVVYALSGAAALALMLWLGRYARRILNDPDGVQ